VEHLINKTQFIIAYVLAVAILAFLPGSIQARAPLKDNKLPYLLNDVRVARNTERWTIPDIVEVRRIRGTAIQGGTRIVAFILEQPLLRDGKSHYGLYQLDAAHGGPPEKIAEADYMADLSWRPHTQDWTVRADFGGGVQLYTVKRSGHHQALLINKDLVMVGGSGGMIRKVAEGPRLTGVISYGWSPDGSRFWYSRLRLRDKSSQNALRDSGIVFEESTVPGMAPANVERAKRIFATELRVFNTVDGSDRLVATSSDLTGSLGFGTSGAFVAWADESHLQYRQLDYHDGSIVPYLVRFDLRSGVSSQTRMASLDDLACIPTKAGYLTVNHNGPNNTLVELALDGRQIKRFGELKAYHLDVGAFWRSAAGDRYIFGTYLSDRLGLDAFEGRLSQALEAIPDSLSACSFNANLSFGVCSEESISKAPMLVSISGTTGEVSVIARPNSRYDAITPLKTIATEWTNRYGAKNSGYITYPRDYIAGRSYPALVVTHGNDARNYFVQDRFQWEFPIQVMAEQGYFILSVNEPKTTPGVPAPYESGAIEAGVAKEQFAQYLNPTASLEAAVDSLIVSGDLNPNAIGIAGYSHGAETAYFVISHSVVFSAASFGDDPGVTPSGFWSGGALSRNWLKTLYGGSPYDPSALENYRKYSTAFRVKQVRAPLLQQFAATGPMGLESDQIFKDSSIPTELVDYPGESHIFYAPRHRASSMVRNLDWFNYWLLGKRDPDAAKADQYSRWDAMAARWNRSVQTTGAAKTEGRDVK